MTYHRSSYTQLLHIKRSCSILRLSLGYTSQESKKLKLSYTYLYSTLFSLHLIKCALHATCNFPAQAPSTVSFLCDGKPPPAISTLWGAYRPWGLPLGAVNLFKMHIIPPLTINAGTHFTYPQGDGGLSQPPARLSQEWVLNLAWLFVWSIPLTTLFMYCKYSDLTLCPVKCLLKKLSTFF